MLSFYTRLLPGRIALVEWSREFNSLLFRLVRWPSGLRHLLGKQEESGKGSHEFESHSHHQLGSYRQGVKTGLNPVEVEMLIVRFNF